MGTLNYRLLYQRNLPHYQPVTATLFVTFRLAGSLPVEVLRLLREEYEHAVAEFDQTLSLLERSEMAYAGATSLLWPDGCFS